jgi:hypothetical protein
VFVLVNQGASKISNWGGFGDFKASWLKKLSWKGFERKIGQKMIPLLA